MIFIDITTFKIIEKFSSARDHFEQAPAGVIVLFVNFEMLRQFVDTLRQKRDLHLRRTGIAIVCFKFVNYFFFYFFCCCHNLLKFSLSLCSQ